jgi:5-hydroxyisourate hydrolase
MSPITTHVLDVSLGQPARGISVVIERPDDREGWCRWAVGVTDDNGRIADFTMTESAFAAGTYRLRFETAAYFRAQGRSGIYPEILVVVHIDDPARHYHLPVLLSPFGYSTYLGT